MRRFLKLVLPILFVLLLAGYSLRQSTSAVAHSTVDWNQTVGAASGQQVGATCYASPRCPDCDGKGNVCTQTKEFFPGLTVLAAKRYMIDKCRRANALDYCGGSYQCVRQKGWNPQQAQRYREQHGGGCYKQCDTSVVCVLDNR